MRKELNLDHISMGPSWKILLVKHVWPEVVSDAVGYTVNKQPHSDHGFWAGQVIKGEYKDMIVLLPKCPPNWIRIDGELYHFANSGDILMLMHTKEELERGRAETQSWVMTASTGTASAMVI